MPTVRRATRQVDLGALPSGYKQAAETPASMGAGVQAAKADTARTIGDFGGMVARIGVERYTKIQDEAKQQADQTALLAASNQLSDWKNQALFDPEHGAFTKQGKDAMPLPEQIKTGFDQATGAIEKGLASDEQRLAFARLKSQEWQSVDLQVRRHVSGEMQQYQAGELKGLVENSINSAIQNAADPKMVDVELTKAVSAIQTNGPHLGLGPAAIQAQVAAVQSQTHVGVIHQLLAREKTQEAQIYFDAKKSQIAGDKQDDLVKALDEGTLRGQGQKQSDAIILAGGTLTEQREKAKAIDNPKLRDEVTSRLEHNAAVTDRAQAEAEQADMKHAYDILDHTANIAKIPPALWTSFTGPERAGMTAYARMKAKGEPVETDPATFYGLMQKAGDDPAAFAKENLLAYRHKLDESDFKQLAGLQLSVKNSDRKASENVLGEFRTRGQLLDDTLTLHGIDPTAKPNTPEGQSIAQLRRMVDQRVETLQGGGKKATNQDIQSEIDGLLSQSVMIPGSWWNIFPGGKPFFDQQKRLLDMTPADIPAADRTQIIDALRKRNRPVSDATILDLYMETHVRRKP